MSKTTDSDPVGLLNLSQENIANMKPHRSGAYYNEFAATIGSTGFASTSIR